MPVTKYLQVYDEPDYDWGQAIREIGRYIREGLDAIWTYLRVAFNYILQLPRMVMNALANIDWEKVKEDVETGVRHVPQFILEHERPVALVLFILALLFGFPIEALISSILFLPRLIFLGILNCVGFRQAGIERGSLAASYQSRNYGAYTPAGSQFARYQSYGAIGMGRMGYFWLILLSWLFMITSIILFIHSFYR